MFTKMCMLTVQFACIVPNKSVLSTVSTTVQPLQVPQGTEITGCRTEVAVMGRSFFTQWSQ